MTIRYTDEFRRDAVRIATTGGLTRPQAASDLGVGLSTLNKWIQKHPHDDVKKENTRLRKEVRLLKEEREILKEPQSIDRQVIGTIIERAVDKVCFHRSLERSMVSRTVVPSFARYIP